MIRATFKRGFTLIELLVVIAIIGILAAVVLASLNSARTKGVDASAKANLNNSRSQAELFFTNNNSSYDGVCLDEDTGIGKMYMAVITSHGNGFTHCDDDDTRWAMKVRLQTATEWYCIDNTGQTKTYNNVTPTQYVDNFSSGISCP